MVEQGRTVVRRTDLVARAVGGETFILDVQGTRLHRVSGVGVRIWELIERPVTPAEIVETLVAEFEVDKETAGKDCMAFLEQLEGLGLLQDG